MPDFLGHEGSYRGRDSVARRAEMKLCLLGAGALGSRLVDLLARQGYANQTIVDRERVALDNFGTQNFGRSDVGRSKAQQCAQNVFRNLGVRVNGIAREVTANNIRQILRGQHLVIDMFDNADSRELVRATCEELDLPCVHAGMGTMGYFKVVWNERYRVDYGYEEDPEAPCDYPLASNLVVLCVGATAEVVNLYIDDGKKKDVDFWLSRMKMGFLEAVKDDIAAGS